MLERVGQSVSMNSFDIYTSFARRDLDSLPSLPFPFPLSAQILAQDHQCQQILNEGLLHLHDSDVGPHETPLLGHTKRPAKYLLFHSLWL